MLKLLRQKQSKLGFTLIEVLLSVAMLALVAGLGAPIYQIFQTRNDLDIAAHTLAHSLRRAQTLSQAVDGDTTWGVHVATGTITIFRGSSYVSRENGFDEVSIVPDTISVAGTNEYVFMKLYGELSDSGTTTLVSIHNERRDVSINTKGTVSILAGVSTVEESDTSVTYMVTITDDWDTGFCAEVDITTESATPISWDVDIPLTTFPTNGTPYNVWNANWSFVDSVLTASGVSWNSEVSAGNPQQFGFCANRPEAPGGEVDFLVTVTTDWGIGYCANVDITTESATPISWDVDIPLTTFPTNGTPYTVWNANWSFAGQTLTASGVGWNDEVSSDQPRAFGYCANR